MVIQQQQGQQPQLQVYQHVPVEPTAQHAPTIMQQEQPQFHQQQHDDQTCESFSHASSSHQRQQQYNCLFTKHLTQKRKKWLDGRLVVKGTRVTLYDANPALGASDFSLDECELGPKQRCGQLSSETKIQTEKHIIEVTGPWKCGGQQGIKRAPLISNGMKKVMQNKFRIVKMGTHAPPPQAQRKQASFLGKRRLPLQPGELERRYYGTQPPQQEQPNWNPPQQPSWNQNSPAQHLGFTHQIPHPPPPLLAYYPQQQQPPPPQEQGWNPDHLQQPPFAADFLGSQSNLSWNPRQSAPTDHQPQATSEKESTPFAANGFDPTNFYGEEEEEGAAQGDQFQWTQNADIPVAPPAGKRQQGQLSTMQLLQLFGDDDNDDHQEINGRPSNIENQPPPNEPTETKSAPAPFQFALPPADSSSEEEDNEGRRVCSPGERDSDR
jgi:hypothetical protein